MTTPTSPADTLREAADALPHATEGVDRRGTARWPENDRDIYSLAIQETQSALREMADEIERDQ